MHPSIFTSQDICELVANFKPSLPTKDQPHLVRSLSGSALLESRKVLSRFRNSIESRSADSRIDVKGLPSLLGVQDTDWIFDTYNDAIRFGRDEQSIITSIEFSRMIEDLKYAAKSAFIELALFATDNNMALKCIDNELLDQLGLTYYTGPSSLTPAYITTPEFDERTKFELKSLITQGGSIVDLSQKFPNVPGYLLRDFTMELMERHQEVKGELEARSERFYFVPTDLREAQEKTTRESLITKHIEKLEMDGYTFVEKGDNAGELRSYIIWTYQDSHQDGDSALTSLETIDGNDAIVVEVKLNEALGRIKTSMQSLAKVGRAHGNATTLEDVQPKLQDQSQHPGLTSLLFRSQYREIISTALASTLHELDYELSHRFEDRFQMMIMAPLHLYSFASFEDLTLRQHQEVYVGEYFSRDIIPHFVKTMKDEGVIQEGQLASDKARMRNTEKLLETCGPSKSSTTSNNSKTLTEVQTGVMRLAKKQKISPPTAEQITQVKRETLQRKGRAIQSMNRGSDVLQNLIWILLARVSEGLFMSSGKDTSRMIEQYKFVGDRDIWERLLKWRDLMKSAKAGEEDIQEMKDLALRLLQEMDITVASANTDSERYTGRREDPFSHDLHSNMLEQASGSIPGPLRQLCE